MHSSGQEIIAKLLETWWLLCSHTGPKGSPSFVPVFRVETHAVRLCWVSGSLCSIVFQSPLTSMLASPNHLDPFICHIILALGRTSQLLLRCPAPEEINYLNPTKASLLPGNPLQRWAGGSCWRPWDILGVRWGWTREEACFSVLGRLTNWPPFYLIGQCRGGVPGKS